MPRVTILSNPPTAAKRGEFVVVEKTSSAVYGYGGGSAPEVYKTFYPAIVTSVGHNGIVKVATTKYGQKFKPERGIRFLTVPSSQLNGVNPVDIMVSLDRHYDDLNTIKAVVTSYISPVKNPKRRRARRNPCMPCTHANPASGDVVEVYRGVSITYRGGYYIPNVVSATGSNVSMPRMTTLTAARKFVGFALKRGAVAREQWKPSVRNNPPSSKGQVMSQRVMEIRYRHVEDGKLYKHPFGPGVCAMALENGTVLLYHKNGKPLTRNF